MPGIGLAGQPRSVTGRICRVCDGRYRNRGPMGRGELNDMGPTAVLNVAGIDVVVISNHVEPNDLAALTAVGMAPDRLRYLMLKCRIHWRAGLRPLSQATVACAGTGVCSSDYALLGLHRVRRPIYPIDAHCAPAEPVRRPGNAGAPAALASRLNLPGFSRVARGR